MTNVSVLVPAYNAAETLGETLASITAQTIQPREIILIDDGSTDATAEIAARTANVNLLSQPNSGPSAALNRGVAAARGEWLAFLDADDMWTPDAMAAHFAALHDQDGEVAVGLVEEFLHDSGDRTVEIRPPSTGWLSGATIMRRALWDELGGLPPDLRVGGWVDLMDRVRRRQAGIVQHDTLVLRRRIRRGPLSSSAARNADWLQVAQRAIERRRNGR